MSHATTLSKPIVTTPIGFIIVNARVSRATIKHLEEAFHRRKQAWKVFPQGEFTRGYHTDLIVYADPYIDREFQKWHDNELKLSMLPDCQEIWL